RGPQAQTRRNECLAARDGGGAEFRPMQSWPSHLRGIEAYRYRAAIRTALACPQEHKFGVVILAPFEFGESFRRLEGSAGCLLHLHQSLRFEPAACPRRQKRLFRKTFPVRRIEKPEGKRFQWMHWAESGCIAAENAGDAAETECFHVVAQQGARFDPIID